MANRGSSLRIVVTGLAGAYPVGGVAWDYLQYPIGLSQLGHDVVYHEDSRLWPYHPIENQPVESGDYSAEYLARFFRTYAPELAGSWHYRHLGRESFGLSETEFQRFAQSADLFLNVSAASILPERLSPRCTKAFLDTDPGYNQIVLSERPPWFSETSWWLDQFRQCDRYLTYAENIGRPDCLVPQLGVRWITTRMPIVLPLWETLPAPRGGAWSTIMTWNAFRGPLSYRGREYGSKDREFPTIAALPQHRAVPFVIAVGGGAPVQTLAEQGWNVVSAPDTTLTPQSYRDFIAQSRGEISVAKNVYVAMRTGWFSCRTACYLASGRPAVVQNTGFSKDIQASAGLFAFDDLAGASRAIHAVETEYEKHSQAARDIAQTYFDSRKVLADMLNGIFSA